MTTQTTKTTPIQDELAQAQAAYQACGFANAMLDPAHGRMLFWSKAL